MDREVVNSQRIEEEYVKVIFAGEEILIRADSEKRIIDVVAYILITKDDVDDTHVLRHDQRS